jgi:hypothetical protein
MSSMFVAEPAVLIHFKPVRIIFLVFHRVIVSLLAIPTSESYLGSHMQSLRQRLFYFLDKKKDLHNKAILKLTQFQGKVNIKNQQ